MKIAHVIDYFQPKLGYQETYFALAQIKAGHEVKVFTSDRYYPFADYDKTYQKILSERIVGCGETVERNVPTVRLETLVEIGSNVLLKGLRKTIVEFNPEIIICHGVISFSSFIISKIKFRRNVKILFDDHMLGTTKETFKRRLMRFMFLTFFKQSVEKSAHKIIGVTRVTQKSLERKLLFNKQKIAYLPLGFDPDIFYFSPRYRKDIRKKYKIPDSNIVGIYAGKINRDKGISQLIDALKYLFSKYDNFKFIFIGNGDPCLLDRIRNEISPERIIIKDFISQEDLHKYYSAVDFGIWPDGITASHIEAAACKLPIIVSSLPAAAERVEGNNGISLHRCDKEEISKTIEILLIDEKLREEFSRNALKYTEALSWPALNNKLLAL